jgi:hypothetical protein
MNSTSKNQTFTGDSIYPIEFIPYLVLNAIGIVVGGFGKIKLKNKFIIKINDNILIKGNILLISAILCTKKLKAEISNIIILSMTIAHFYSSVVVGTFAQIGFIFGEEFFNKVTGFCGFIAFTCLLVCQIGFFNSGLLAFNRHN